MAMPASQAAARAASGSLMFGKAEEAKGGRWLLRSCDNGRRVGVTMKAVNGSVKLNGAAVAGVRQVHTPPQPTLSVDDDGGAFRLGKFVEGRLVYRQQFVIRSYEIGPDRTATMETIMNLLQVHSA